MTFKTGDLVWAKMKGFPPWPGVVSQPPDGLVEGALFKSNMNYSCVFFFGTHDYGFIEHNQLKPYLPFKEKMRKIAKSAKFKLACSEIEEHYQKNQDTSADKTIETELNSDENKTETKPSVIGGEGTIKLYPRIKLVKLEGVEKFLPPKSENNGQNKRLLASPKRVAKKKKTSNFSDPDTTTPLDTMCQSSYNASHEDFSKEENSINSSDEHSGEEEEAEEEAEQNTDSFEERTETSSDDIMSSSNKIGFIGLGTMGKTIVHRLLQDGHQLVVWNRSPDKVIDFQNLGVTIAESPAEVVASSKITFCCVADGRAAKDVLFTREGALMSMTPEKSFVDLSSSGLESSLDMSEVLYAKGSRYLEVRLHGNVKNAEEGSLICLTAGDESLHKDCQFFFQSCCKQSFFMGETGNASKFYLVMQSVAGVALAGLAECMALADRAGLDQSDLLNIIKISQINCPLIVEKATAMVNGEYSAKMALKNMQNDLQNLIAIGEDLEQPTPVTATANEIFKHSKKVGYGTHDVSAVYLASKF